MCQPRLRLALRPLLSAATFFVLLSCSARSDVILLTNAPFAPPLLDSNIGGYMNYMSARDDIFFRSEQSNLTTTSLAYGDSVSFVPPVGPGDPPPDPTQMSASVSGSVSISPDPGNINHIQFSFSNSASLTSTAEGFGGIGFGTGAQMSYENSFYVTTPTPYSLFESVSWSFNYQHTDYYGTQLGVASEAYFAGGDGSVTEYLNQSNLNWPYGSYSYSDTLSSRGVLTPGIYGVIGNVNESLLTEAITSMDASVSSSLDLRFGALATVPEPSTFLLFGACIPALLALIVVKERRKKRRGCPSGS